jgi:hypothetical protein
MSPSAILHDWRSSRYLQPTSVQSVHGQYKNGGIVELFRIRCPFRNSCDKDVQIDSADAPFGNCRQQFTSLSSPNSSSFEFSASINPPLYGATT